MKEHNNQMYIEINHTLKDQLQIKEKGKANKAFRITEKALITYL